MGRLVGESVVGYDGGRIGGSGRVDWWANRWLLLQWWLMMMMISDLFCLCFSVLVVISDLFCLCFSVLVVDLAAVVG